MSNVESVETVNEQNVEQVNSKWEVTQEIMIDAPFMDTIVAMYLSTRNQMDGEGTRKLFQKYISTSKGHGIDVGIYDRNICIRKKRKVE